MEVEEKCGRKPHVRVKISKQLFTAYHNWLAKVGKSGTILCRSLSALDVWACGWYTTL